MYPDKPLIDTLIKTWRFGDTTYTRRCWQSASSWLNTPSSLWTLNSQVLYFHPLKSLKLFSGTYFDILIIKGVVIYPTNSCENEDYGYQLVKPQLRLFNQNKSINIQNREINEKKVNWFTLFSKVKGNVDLLKLIQLGITLFDSGGHLPEGVCTWQVNKIDICDQKW